MISPFPDGYLCCELYISGAWVDVSDDITEDGVQITRGRASEGEDIDPAAARITLLNPIGRYSPRNPRSDLYGLIGRNTPVRIGIRPDGTGTSPWWRFWGEVAAWPQSWGPTGDVSAVAELECAGVMRRLVQGASAVRSPWYRGVLGLGSVVAAYWPLEDPAGSTSCSVAVGRVRGATPMRFTGEPKLASYSDFKAAAGVPTIGSAWFAGAVGTPAYPGALQVRALVRVPAATPTGSVLLRTKLRGRTTSAAKLTTVELVYLTGGSLRVVIYDDDAATTLTGSILGATIDDVNALVSVELETSGSNVIARVVTSKEAAPGALYVQDTITSASVGNPTSVEINPRQASLGEVAIGHVSVETVISSVFTLDRQLDGWDGEPAAERIVRLAAEEGITLSRSTVHAGQPLGVQQEATVLDLMREAARADGGMLFEPRNLDVDLYYYPGRRFYGLAPAVQLTAVDNFADVTPVDDDASTRNQVTVTRVGGSEATVVRTDGPMGTAAIGVYDTDVQLSLSSDDQCADQAAWRVHLGTIDEARWPTVGVDMAHPQFDDTDHRTAMLQVSAGSVVEITDLPPWLPPGPVQLLVQGQSEEIGVMHHTITMNCTPYSAYRVAAYSESVGVPSRYDGTGTVTASTLTAAPGSVSLTVTPPAEVAWTHDDGDYDVTVAGERMTVTAVAGDVLTVTRGVNGVLKAHAVGEALSLADPYHIGL